MSDPRLLIEHVGEMYVKRDMDTCRGVDFSREIRFLKTRGKNVLVLNLIRSLYAEANMSLDSKPHHNQMFNYYSHQEDNICRRPRDTTPIEISSHLYEFTFLRELLPPCNINWDVQADSSCIIMINDIPPSVAESVLLACSEISQNQIITDLWLEEFHCDPSREVPADVFNMSKTAESITVVNNTLPVNLMEHLLGQLPQCKHLNKLVIDNVRLCNPASTSQSNIPSLSSLFKDWHDNTPTTLTLTNCSGSEDSFSFLYTYKKLINLNLSNNNIGESGIQIAKTIDSMGVEPPLRSLYLGNCSIPSDICGEILKCLSQCKHLAHLDLSGHDLHNQGKHLVQIFRNFGADPPLQALRLRDCSIPEEQCAEILKCLPSCRHLIILDLNRNKLGVAGKHIMKTIENMGLEPPLESLYLRNCSIPSAICIEILECLSQCKNLKHLDLGGHDIGNQEKHLPEVIKNIGPYPSLEAFYLPYCSISELECVKVLKYLPSCRHLTTLDLNRNKVGIAGKHIVKTIEKMGVEPPLESLYLRNCSIPSDICGEILECLLQCKHLKHLDLGEHDLGSHGDHIVKIFKNIDKYPPLQALYLPDCSIPEEKCTEVVKYLLPCKHLTILDLNKNNIGETVMHITKELENMGLASPFETLFLRDSATASDLSEDILNCLSQGKHFDLSGYNSVDQGEYLAEIIKNGGFDLPNWSIPVVEYGEVQKCFLRANISLLWI